MTLIKHIFYKNKILKTWDTSDEEALKQWVIKTDIIKELDKDIESIDKAKAAIDGLVNRKKPKDSDIETYRGLRKKYRDIFKQNNEELENPNHEDVLINDSLSLDEINETIDDRKRILSRKYYQSIIEIFNSSERGVIVRPTSGGLYKSKTLTSDFIENLPQEYNPFDDMGID